MTQPTGSPTVVAIGNFDGVHLGHQKVIREALGDGQLPLIVITFWPHPMSVLFPERAPKLICDLRSRIELLKAAGAHEVRVVHFDERVAALSPAEFVQRVLLPMHPKRVVVGRNFRFGARAAGDPALLAELGNGRFEVTAMQLRETDGQVTCSSLVRACLEAGDVVAAARHLGRPACFRGVVVVGDQRGRELGFPTANQSVPPEMAAPADGVYAGWTILEDGSRLPAAISVGTNPTFEGWDRRVESYVLDRDDLELYGTEITVEFRHRLRGQVKFEDVDDLVAQMRSDVERCRELLLD